MRHGNTINHLGRTYGHRSSMLSNLAISLITKKRIVTTVAKAKELRKFVEPLITKSKDNSTHSRRVVFSYLQNKEASKELFDVVGPKVFERPGGYTRIIKAGFRPGDNAELAYIELVDFNEVYVSTSVREEAKKKTRRGRKKADKPTDALAGNTASSPEASLETTAEEETQ